MWYIENQTAFQADRCFTRDETGAEFWLVAVKATYDIFPDGTSEISEEQVDVNLGAVHRGTPGESSLMYESDFALEKPVGTDIVLNGTAYAPNSEPIKEMEVALSVAGINKKLRIVGERTWEKGLLKMSPSETRSFISMPIVYEKAFGGTDNRSKNPKKPDRDYRNPVGTGFAVCRENLLGKPLPSIFHSSKNKIPAGFGAIPIHWEPRINFAGTYDDKWKNTRHPLVPSDFDRKLFQCAPMDQQSNGYLKGSETVILKNLTPDGFLKFNLTQEKFTFITIIDGTDITHDANLHKVVIEPDFPRVSLVWHTCLRCQGREHLLEKTIIRNSKQ